MLPRRRRAQILAHRDGPRNDRHADAKGQQQKERQLGAAGIAAPARAVQPAERQQHREHPERQHGKQRVAHQRKRQKAPLLRRQPTGLVVGVAQPAEQRRLGQQKADQKAAQQRGIAGQLRPPRRLVMPPDPRAHKHPGDQIIERDLLVQIQQVAKRPRRRAPAHAGLRLCQHRPQEKIHLPQRQRQKHRLAHKRTRSGHRGQHCRNADEKRRAAAVHAHGPCQRIGREHRACHIYGVQPADGRDLRGGGFQQQRRQDAERV